MPEEKKPDTILQFTKVLAWPVIVLLAIIVFLGPLRETANLIPGLLKNSESVTIGSFSVNVGKKLGRYASDDVRNVLAALDANEIRVILSDSASENYFMDSTNREDKDLEHHRKFVYLGLETQLSESDLDNHFEDDRKDDPREAQRAVLGFSTTQLYDETHDFLLKFLAEVISELNLKEPLTKTTSN